MPTKTKTIRQSPKNKIKSKEDLEQPQNECAICFEKTRTTSVSSKAVRVIISQYTVYGCSHIFHKECLKNYILTYPIKNAESTFNKQIEEQTIYCPQENCKNKLSYEFIFNEQNTIQCDKCKQQYNSNSQTLTVETMNKQEYQSIKDLKIIRCGNCLFWIQRNHGCRHITCNCGHESCFLCGKDWNGGACNCEEEEGYWEAEEQWEIEQENQEQYEE